MTTYSVFITTVREYTVDALDSDTAERACLDVRQRVDYATIPELIGEDVTRVKSEPTFNLVVQVVFEHASGTKSSPYAYGVPDSLDVRIGDDVLVPPAGYRAQPSIARVVNVGRGGYDGPLKALVGKVVKPDEDEIDLRDFSEYDETQIEDDREDKGFGTCPDCGHAYQWEGGRPCSELGGPF